MNNLRQSTKPLAGNSVASGADPLANPQMGAAKKPAATPPPTAFGVPLTTPASPAPVPIPGLQSSLSNALTASQNQANNANNQRYTQGLGVLAGGQQTQQTDIQDAMNSVANNTLAQQTTLGQNLQANLGTATQKAATSGLGNTTIASTMQDLPTRQYNDAMNQLAAQQSQLTSGLQTQAGQAAASGSGSIANYIAGRTDAGPNAAQYAQLAQNAANKPGTIQQAAGGIAMNGAPGNPTNTQTTPSGTPGGGGASTGQTMPGTTGGGTGDNWSGNVTVNDGTTEPGLGQDSAAPDFETTPTGMAMAGGISDSMNDFDFG